MKNDLGKFEVEDAVYKFRHLSPMEGLEFGSRVAKLIAPTLMGLGNGAKVADIVKGLSAVDSSEMTDLIKEALGHCYTPESEALDNEAVFNHWFGEHPDHLFTAGVLAVYNLAKPFFPNKLLTGLGANSLQEVAGK